MLIGRMSNNIKALIISIPTIITFFIIVIIAVCIYKRNNLNRFEEKTLDEMNLSYLRYVIDAECTHNTGSLHRDDKGKLVRKEGLSFIQANTKSGTKEIKVDIGEKMNGEAVNKERIQIEVEEAKPLLPSLILE